MMPGRLPGCNLLLRCRVAGILNLNMTLVGLKIDHVMSMYELAKYSKYMHAKQGKFMHAKQGKFMHAR